MRAFSLLLLAAVALLSSACKLRQFNSDSSTGSATGNKNCSQVSCATEAPVWALSDDSCKRNPSDRFEFGGVIRFGQFAKPGKGTCIDKSHVRPVVLLSGEDAKVFGLSTDLRRTDYSSPVRSQLLGDQFSAVKNIVIANVEDINDQLLVAQIPVDAIEDVFFHIEKFDLGFTTGAHGQLRVTFSRPVKFKAQFPAGNQGPLTEAYDLILSVNGVRTPNVPFDPVHLGMTDAYANGWGVLTLRERYLDSALVQGNSTEQWRLKLSSDQAQKVLLSYLGWSEFWEYRRVYHTLLQSCGTEQFYNFDSAIGPELGVRKPSASVPYMPKEAQAGSGASNVPSWEGPTLFKLDKGAQQSLTRFLKNSPGDAVADMFPLHSADGLFGAGGPLRDRKLIAQGDEDRVEDMEEFVVRSPAETRVGKLGGDAFERQRRRSARVRSIHDSLCAMAKQNSANGISSGGNSEVWTSVLKRCEAKPGH